MLLQSGRWLSGAPCRRSEHSEHLFIFIHDSLLLLFQQVPDGSDGEL